MLSSEEEQDDNIFDQLRNIRPFTIDQLYLLHPDVGCPPSSAAAQQAEYNRDQFSQDQEVYQNLVEYEQLRQRLIELKSQVKKIYKKTHDHVDKAWVFKEESIRKIALCQQGKIAETTFKYKQAIVNTKQLETFSLGFNQLIEAITKDYIYYSFESQMKRHKIATTFSIAYQIEDLETRRSRLRCSLITLIEFMKKLSNSKSDLVVQCRKWFRALAERLLEENTTDNNRFIIALLARSPAGVADWSSDLIECKPYEQTHSFDSVPQYITHCSALLTELFYSSRARIKRADESNIVAPSSEEVGEEVDQSNISNKDCSMKPNMDDQNWSLVDPRFACTEELNISSSFVLLSEADVIKICLKIPVAQIFRAFVKKCLTLQSDNDEFHLGVNRMNCESIMVKLLTIGTVIIKTYQIGLETFNSIQYGSLIEYLSSQIRRTVIILSENWIEFKNRLRGIDDALLMRLQVEYDNFILRSIMIILELRQSGIWRHLSRFEPGSDYNTNGDLGNGCDIEEGPHSWSTDSLRPAFAKLLQVTGLSTAGQNDVDLRQQGSQQIANDDDKADKTMQVKTRQRSSMNSLTYEFSIEWFREVSEPMLWHILWQLYHNAFMTSCNYNSDSYWLEKFREKSAVYLFVNKIKDSPPGECSYLLNSITSMLLSRTRSDSKLANFIATEIFNLSYRHKSLRDKITKRGTRSLIRSTEKFPKLMSLYLSLMVDVGLESDEALISSELSEDVIELIKGCSLTGWLCNQEELNLLASWLIEFPLQSVQNKVSRIILSKILLNSPESREEIPQTTLMLIRNPINRSSRRTSTASKSQSSASQRGSGYFVDLKMRRRLALLLYEASIRHAPEQINDLGAQSLGASVEVAFGGLYCEQNLTMQNNLLELATEVSYNQFYVWCWRLLFTLRLHILNQPETDWNDLTARSGTSRSTRNTVLINDSFHPVPTVQDCECLLLAEGIKKSNPMASYIYLTLTDATWQVDSFEQCLIHLNILVNSGHLTPSLMAMKFFTICHLNEPIEVTSKDKKCLEYFTTLITSNFDTTRLASLITSQLDRLKQFRQIQLSQFYVNIFLEVTSVLARQLSSSWFTTNEVSLEKIACLLDYLVKFNFATQRTDIIHKFYDCAYMVNQDAQMMVQAGWFGSLFSSNTINSSNTTKREFLTNLHLLTQKFKKYFWLRWITTECDTLRLEKIWEDIVVYLSGNEDATLDMAMRRVCPQVNASILKTVLPIHSWIRQIFDIMESDLNHPLCPLIWYNFFLNYFANSLNGASVGYKLVQNDTLVTLTTRLDSLFNYHLYKQRNWSKTSPTSGATMQHAQNSLAKLYRAYKLWLQDSSLRDAYVDMDKLNQDYLVPLLKAVMESSSGSDSCLQYIDVQSIVTQNRNLTQVWLTATKLQGNHLIKEMVFVDSQADESMEILTSIDDEASDATALLHGQDATLPEMKKQESGIPTNSSIKWCTSVEDELSRPLKDDLVTDEYRTSDELIDLIKKNFNSIFEEANTFNMNTNELDRTKSEIIELARRLYKNKKREFLRVVACSDGNECIGPARIKLEAEEAMMDERTSHCIQDRRRQCQELVGELLLMPKNRSIQSIVLIEQSVKRLVDDPTRARHTIELLLSWMSEPANYKHLDGSYYVANHLLKMCLEILSTCEHEIDAFNRSLIEVCLQHPASVQILGPHLKPSACSNECFLELYKICTGIRQKELGPMATFVLLSKFDLTSWLDNLCKLQQQQQSRQKMHHDLIRATCSALQNMGKQPDESYELAMGLFRRHLHIELALPDRRRPEELMLVVDEFLRIMNEQQLAPRLWVDFMTIMGLEQRRKRPVSNQKSALARAVSSPKRGSTLLGASGQQSLDDSSVLSLALSSPLGQEHDESTIGDVLDNVTRLAESQTIFDYHSLCSLMEMMCNFMRCQDESADNATLVELYSAYLDKYASFMLSVSFMWIRSTSEQYPDNHEMIWKQFMSLWNAWVFLQKNCQNVTKSNYSLVANYFVASIRYMIQRMPDNTQQILQSVLTTLTTYISQTREIVYLELTILQRCLKNLPWSSLIASCDDFEKLCAASEQENYNISDLISHIISQLDARRCLNEICQQTPELVPRVSERLATTIVLQSTHLKGYRLQAIFFSSIPIERASRLSDLILQRMEFVNLEHNQNNKLLVNLLRFICIKWDNSSSNSSQQQHQYSDPEDGYKRSLVYGHFVSSYLIDLVKRHPTVIKFHRAYLTAVLDNSLQDLKPLLLASHLNLTQKTIIYESLLECCSNDSLEPEQRLLLSQLIIESNLLKNRPLVVLEILHAVGQILRDGRVLVETVEELILMYLNMNGHYEKVWRSFCLKVLPSDIYLDSCVDLRASLAMLVYFESLVRGRQLTAFGEAQTNDNHPNSKQQAQMTDSTCSNSSSYNCTRIWSSFFHWLSQMIATSATNSSNQSLSSEESILIDTKLAITLPRMLELLETNLRHFIHGDSHRSSNLSSNLESGLTTEQQQQQQQPEATKEPTEQQQSEESSSGNGITAKTSPAPSVKLSNKKQQAAVDLANKLLAHHKCLLELIKQLLTLYDSLNAGGIWSYLSMSSSKNEHSTRLSITALAVATFLVNQTLSNLSESMSDHKETSEHLLALRQEMSKHKRSCLSRLEAARKSKSFLNSIQFIETMIECSQQGFGDKVHYMEGVQLITTYVRLAFSRQQRPLERTINPSIKSNAIETTSVSESPSLVASTETTAATTTTTTTASSSSSLSTEAKISACLSKILPTL